MVVWLKMEAVSSAAAGPHGAPAEEHRDLIRHRLADVTRGLRWSYSIFWSFCPEQQVLVWGEGYVNGADSTELCLRRSQQLRNLYDTMEGSTAGVQPFSSENNNSPSRSSTSVSVHDLTLVEWFYVGSMGVIFASGDGLPGLALAGRSHVWHHVTSDRDNRVLVRVRLAQRARLQTIVCIPTFDGVLEIGTTALVEQNPNLLQQMQSLFLEQPTQHPTIRTSSSTKTTGLARESRASGGMRASTSAFKVWRIATTAAAAVPLLPKHPQWMLKAVVFTVPHLYADKREVQVEEKTSRGVSEQAFQQSKHVMAERRRRKEVNKRFETLRKLVPFVTKPSKESLLGDAIEYVIELQRQVGVLESTAKRSSETKIKQGVRVTIEKRMVVMKISSAWQDDQLVNILKKMEDLQLEVVDVNADVSDNTLDATLKAKVRSSDQGNDENKTAEIREALLNLIEGLRGKAMIE